MLFAHKVVLCVLQRRGLPWKTEQKAEFFFTRYCFVVKPTYFLIAFYLFFNLYIFCSLIYFLCRRSREIILRNKMWSLSSTTFLLHLLSVFFYFFNFLLSQTRHRNVGHMTWYQVRNIPAQLCYAPDDSQLFRALVSMHPLSQYTRVS